MSTLWHHVTHWMAGKLMYCPKCRKDMPFEKSVWDGAWVCKKCGYRMK